MRDMETQKSIVVSVASGVIRFILAQLPQISVWDLRTTGKPTRMSGRFLCLSETKQEIIELFRMHTDDNCYFEKLTHFSWPHIEAQLLLNSRALCLQSRSSVWQRLGSFRFPSRCRTCITFLDEGEGLLPSPGGCLSVDSPCLKIVYTNIFYNSSFLQGWTESSHHGRAGAGITRCETGGLAG